jgi:hypothetical protein
VSAQGRRAAAVLALLLATVTVGIVLLVAFDTDVQTVNARELVQRGHDAREFFAGDYVFILLYAVLSPIALWRFGAGLGRSPRLWTWAGALLLVGAGLFDSTENALLLSATGSPSQGSVDAAHVVAVPKTVLFVLGALLVLAANARAIAVLRTRQT